MDLDWFDYSQTHFGTILASITSFRNFCMSDPKLYENICKLIFKTYLAVHITKTPPHECNM